MMMSGSNLNRRDFLGTCARVALAPFTASFLQAAHASEPGGQESILVVLQLGGGNDGINTVVPFADEGYARHRRALQLPKNRLLKVNDHIGLHPSLRGVAELLEDGRLAIVQGVGYPNPNRSHDVSMAIWHTARFEPSEHASFGWLGRAMDVAGPRPGNSPQMVLLGDEVPPVAIRSRRSTSVALAHLEDLKLRSTPSLLDPHSGVGEADELSTFVQRSALQAYATAERLDQLSLANGTVGAYPASQLAERLQSIAQLIKMDFGSSVYYAIQAGYDTHSAQLPVHARLLDELSAALKAFLDDLEQARLAERVVVLCFSEFGRRVQENASHGTDHGTAGPVLVAGPSVQAGVVGSTPRMLELEDGDLKMGIDFRHVYSSILTHWLGVEQAPVLSGEFNDLHLFRDPVERV